MKIRFQVKMLYKMMIIIFEEKMILMRKMKTKIIINMKKMTVREMIKKIIIIKKMVIMKKNMIGKKRKVMKIIVKIKKIIAMMILIIKKLKTKEYFRILKNRKISLFNNLICLIQIISK